MTWEKEFADLNEYYPGSASRIFYPVERKDPEPEPQGWDANPRKGIRQGREYEFFTIGHLAAALNKQPVTIRLWESRGIIPTSGQRSESTFPNKRQRLYTRPQIEGIVAIAADEGILNEARPRIQKTKFVSRVLDLFIELAKQPHNGARPLGE